MTPFFGLTVKKYPLSNFLTKSKKRRMETVTEEELTRIENRLNRRPRKRLGFKTFHKVFHTSFNRVVLRP